MKKQVYAAPRVEVFELRIEESIAAGSVKVGPTQKNTEFTHEWEDTQTINRDYTW